jgi:hypothetical protein
MAMSADVLTPARVGHRLSAAASNGLWRAMTDRVRRAQPLPTVEVSDLSPGQSMFDYDPGRAVALTELPDLI